MLICCLLTVIVAASIDSISANIATDSRAACTRLEVVVPAVFTPKPLKCAIFSFVVTFGAVIEKELATGTLFTNVLECDKLVIGVVVVGVPIPPTDDVLFANIADEIVAALHAKFKLSIIYIYFFF